MNNKVIYIGVALVIVAIGVGVFLTNNSNSSKDSIHMEHTNSDTQDKQFIIDMIPHHEGAIVMAELAQTKAQRPEIKQMAGEIIKAQAAEIEQMKSWYKEWYGTDVPESSSMHAGHDTMSMSEEDLTALETAEDFDIEFIEQMIPHHEMAVTMAEELKNETTRSELQKLADNIIVSQKKEVKQMNEWLRKWSK